MTSKKVKQSKMWHFRRTSENMRVLNEWFSPSVMTVHAAVRYLEAAGHWWRLRDEWHGLNQVSSWAEQSRPLNHLFWFCPVSKSMSRPTIILDLWLILQITLVWQARTGFSGVENTLLPDSAVDIILHQVVWFSNWQRKPKNFGAARSIQPAPPAMS